MFKKLFLKWLFEFVGWLLVIALASGIFFVVVDITKYVYIGVIVLATIYFYCSPIINPYINELRNKILKNIGKKEDK